MKVEKRGGKGEMNKVEELIKGNRRMIESEWFKEQHRKTKKELAYNANFRYFNQIKQLASQVRNS